MFEYKDPKTRQKKIYCALPYYQVQNLLDFIYEEIENIIVEGITILL